MSLEPIQSTNEDTSNNKCFKCPYCPKNSENMTHTLLKLHVKKVHRISCVEEFVCPKCTQSVFDPSINDVHEIDDIKENLEDRNMSNHGITLRKSAITGTFRKSLMFVSKSTTGGFYV